MGKITAWVVVLQRRPNLAGGIFTFSAQFTAAIARGSFCLLPMSDFDADDDLDAISEDENAAEQAAQFDADLQRQIALLPPELYENMRLMLLFGSVANHVLLGHDDDPVPQTLKERLEYDFDTLKIIMAATDTPRLARVMAMHTIPLFDFVLVSRLVYESALDEPLWAYLARHQPPGQAFANPCGYLLAYSEGLLWTTPTTSK